MPSVPTPDDVFEGVRARLTGDALYAALVPGGTWFSRRPDGKGFPYAVMTLEERDPDYVQSDGAYLQTYAAEVTVWCASGDDTAAITGAVRARLDVLLGWNPTDPANGVTVPNAVAVVHVRPAGGSLKLSPELRSGQDVLAAGKRFEVRLQGKR